MTRYDLIAFDADDTLWHSEIFYVNMKESFAALMAPYHDGRTLEAEIDRIEMANMRLYGYGIKSFLLSLVEAAVQLSAGAIPARDLTQILNWGKQALAAEVELFDEARATVAALAARYTLVMITKGDLVHQESKLARSGLKEYFRNVEIVSDKTPEVYAAILKKHGVSPEHFLMVGDSLRSDILPVVALGGKAVFIPHTVVWGHERPDVPKEAQGKYAVLEHIGLLPAWVAEQEI